MNILSFLENNNISYEIFEHPAVYTCEEAGRLVPKIDGAKTKNLFLRDKKGERHFLVVVPADKAVNISALQDVLKSSKLSFASAERLKTYLGIDPGSVSILALINDKQEKQVELFIDKQIWEMRYLQCHPLVNTATLRIPVEGIKEFINKTGHTVNVIETPVFT